MSGTAAARQCPTCSRSARDLQERKQRDGEFRSWSRDESHPTEGLRDPSRVLCSRAQEPLCHHVWVLGERGQVRKHQPNGLSGAGLQNPPHPQPRLRIGHLHAATALPASPQGSRHRCGHASPCSATGVEPCSPPGHPSLPRPSLPIPACQPPVEPQIHPQPGPSTLQGGPLPMGNLFLWGYNRQGPARQLLLICIFPIYET